MKSKTPRTSKSSRAKANSETSWAVGHRPAGKFSKEDERLYQAFQSNLLSLISHELRTPLTGVLNSLTVLEENPNQPNQKEWLQTALKNAKRLQQNLTQLLDLAAIESGNFHLRLREVDLFKLLQALPNSIEIENQESTPILADPQKLSRAFELCLQVLQPRSTGSMKFRISSNTVYLQAQIESEVKSAWDEAWLRALAGFQGGAFSPTSAFAGVVQSEEAFLSRTEEGLGSELILVHEMIRLHGAKLTFQNSVELKFEFPKLSTQEALQTVLTSRAYAISSELASVAFVLIDVTDSFDETFQTIKKSLFRTTDAAYPLPSTSQVALVLDDCKSEDVSKFVERVFQKLGKSLPFGFAQCPTDGLDPSQLFELAEKRCSAKLRRRSRT